MSVFDAELYAASCALQYAANLSANLSANPSANLSAKLAANLSANLLQENMNIASGASGRLLEGRSQE